MLVKIVDGSPIPYSKSQLKKDNPRVSFSANISDETLATYDVYRVQQDEWTEVNPMIHEVQASPVTLIDGVWRISHTVVELSSEEKTLRLQYLGNENRAKRDTLISETDWWASSDLTMTAEQTAYRQALRDITAHANWPHLDAADWPTKP